VTPSALGGMEVFRPIEFTDALAWLQEAIGREVSVVLNQHGRFFGCGMQGELRRVETLPPDNSAIRIVVGRGEGLFLDPADVTAFLGGEIAETSWLEFRTAFGSVVTVEVRPDIPD
jgi:hypothetical protein